MRNTDFSPTQIWGLTEIEKPWVEVQPYLHSRGYQLRPRYRQGWQPSWPEGASKLTIFGAADAIKMHPGGDILDAVRISDGTDVVIKRTPSNTPEVTIGRFFSSEELCSDPANHCVPLLDTFPDPRSADYVFIVLPLLRRWHDPTFRTIGEFVDFVGQVLEGLDFMHAHNVAHRDSASSNIMMDAMPMYPDGFHPFLQDLAKDFTKHHRAKALTRTQASPKYYFIDFGISSQFLDRDSRSPILGDEGRTRAPELSLKVPYDPFAVDIFAVGQLFLNEVQHSRGLDFLLPLARAMTQLDPQSRPTAKDALREFGIIRESLSQGYLSQTLFHRDQGAWMRAGLTVYETVGLSGLVAIGLVAVLAVRYRSSLFRS